MGVLLLSFTACPPEGGQFSDPGMFKESVQYFRDSKKGLCYAVLRVRQNGGTNGVGFTMVPGWCCED